MTFYVLLAVSLAVAFAGDIYDVTESEKAYAKGYIESFDWLVGPKPTAIKLYLRDGLIIGLSVVPAIVFWAVHNSPLAYGALIAPVVAGIKHYLGGRGAKKLL